MALSVDERDLVSNADVLELAIEKIAEFEAKEQANVVIELIASLSENIEDRAEYNSAIEAYNVAKASFDMLDNNAKAFVKAARKVFKKIS